jgi:uncharacterized membrane protein
MISKLVFPLYALTLIWLMGDTFAFRPAGVDFLAVSLVMLLKMLPALAFLPAVVRRDAGKLLTFSVVLMFYTAYATMLCFKPGIEGWSGMAGTALITALMVVSSLEVKRQGKLRKLREAQS